jgi:hypothetical protein
VVEEGLTWPNVALTGPGARGRAGLAVLAGGGGEPDRALPPELVAGRTTATPSREFQRQVLDLDRNYFTKYQFSG